MIKKYWITPEGTTYTLYADLLKIPHLLVAGSTGSGKSILINGLIYTCLYYSPERNKLILIDPKRVELIQYKRLPHTIAYASESAEMLDTLTAAIDIMENRYKYMAKMGVRKSLDADIYIIIDEFADLITVSKKQVNPLLYRLAQLGRAANIHLIIATQRPTKDIINGQIKVNLDHRIALRCPTKQDSRNIIESGGAELLPRYGYGLYLSPDGLSKIQIPLIPESELTRIINHWEIQPFKRFSWLR